jgi:hypothetical protein
MEPEDYQAVLELARQVFPSMGAEPRVEVYRYRTDRVTIPVIGEPFLFIKLGRYRLPDGREVGLGYAQAGHVLVIDCSGLS